MKKIAHYIANEIMPSVFFVVVALYMFLRFWCLI